VQAPGFESRVSTHSPIITTT